MANGTLPHASFKHYLIQDYIFLTHFARCQALAAYKSSNMADILHAAKIVCYIGDETELHLSYCAEWGIDRTTLASVREARANLAYTRFTLDCGMTGDLLDLYVALSPCLLGYGEVGMRLFKDSSTKQDSPYWKWILDYAVDDYQEACRKGEQLIERLADEYGVWYGAARIKKLTDIFRTATKLEIGFWDMGLNVEW
jgi:hydroxymethylpyrimidine/phosphomethylpyrimidine kinase